MMELQYSNEYRDDVIKFTLDDIVEKLIDFGYGEENFHTGEVQAMVDKIRYLDGELTASQATFESCNRARQAAEAEIERLKEIINEARKIILVNYNYPDDNLRDVANCLRKSDNLLSGDKP
jgi:hypothetical protein